MTLLRRLHDDRRPPLADPPFRLAPRVPAPDDPAVEALLAEVRARVDDSVPRDRLQGWLGHADERVVIATLTSRRRILADEPTLKLAVWQRADADARDEGLVWTPVLDAIAAQQLWPAADLGPAEVAGEAPVVRSAEEQAAGLLPWLRAQEDPERVAALLEFHAPAVRAAVAEHAPCLDTRLLTHLLDHSWEQIAAAARNRTLGAAQVTLLAEVAARWLAREPARAGVAGAALAALRAAGHRSLGHGAQELTSVIRQSRELAATAPIPHATALALETVLDDPETPAATLRQALRACRWHADWLCRIAVHPAADVELWADLLRVSRDPELRRTIARVPAARTDVAVRRLLSQSSDAEVLCSLVEDADPGDLPYLVRRLASVFPKLLLTALARAAAEGRLRATRSDLQPLLEHPDAGVRAAITAILQG